MLDRFVTQELMLAVEGCLICLTDLRLLLESSELIRDSQLDHAFESSSCFWVAELPFAASK